MDELEEFNEMLAQSKNWLPDFYPSSKNEEATLALRREKSPI